MKAVEELLLPKSCNPMLQLRVKNKEQTTNNTVPKKLNETKFQKPVKNKLVECSKITSNKQLTVFNASSASSSSEHNTPKTSTLQNVSPETISININEVIEIIINISFK